MRRRSIKDRIGTLLGYGACVRCQRTYWRADIARDFHHIGLGGGYASFRYCRTCWGEMSHMEIASAIFGARLAHSARQSLEAFVNDTLANPRFVERGGQRRTYRENPNADDGFPPPRLYGIDPARGSDWTPGPCKAPQPEGFECLRAAGHAGPCAPMETPERVAASLGPRGPLRPRSGDSGDQGAS